MQQAYRALRIIAEAQTIRVVLSARPGELMLKELRTACATLDTQSSKGVKAVVLDFGTGYTAPVSGSEAISQAAIDEACAALRAVTQPVLAVVHRTLSAAASALVCVADLTLVAHDAVLLIPGATPGDDTLTGAQAARLGYVTWSVLAQNVDREMEHILDLLRGKSAIALRLVKASVHLGQKEHPTRPEALDVVNAFYLTHVMQTADASEGLRAFLEKRQPAWKNA
jgi:enoyl-CoA hydratase/carnithine racemase